MKALTFTATLFFLGLLIEAKGQLTQEQFILNSAKQYHFSKEIVMPGATETDIVAKTKAFLKEHTEHLEGTVWEQVKGKNAFEAAMEIQTPRLLIMSVTISIIKDRYTYDIKGIQYYFRERWWPAELVLGSTKSEFNNLRTDVLEGVSNLCKDIEKGIK